MIIMIGGIPCSGKSTLMRNLIKEMGSHENVEPMKLFPYGGNILTFWLLGVIL